MRYWLVNEELETIEQVGSELGGTVSACCLGKGGSGINDVYVVTVPINVKDRDVFHLTIEEYLLALTNTVDELVCFHLSLFTTARHIGIDLSSTRNARPSFSLFYPLAIPLLPPGLPCSLRSRPVLPRTP